MLDAVSLSLGGTAGVETKTDAARASLGQTYDQFLSLLTTQLKNQDPLNPMDSKDFTNQLVNMANVEQQIAQTQKTDELIKLSQASAINQSLNYIGLDVDYKGDTIAYDGSPAPIKYNLEDTAVKGKISVLDSKGAVVWSKDIDKTAGAHEVLWMGETNAGTAAPKGKYTVQLSALNKDDATVKNTLTVPGLVTGVDTSADGQVLLVIGDQKVPINSVTSANMRVAYQVPSSSEADAA